MPNAIADALLSKLVAEKKLLLRSNPGDRLKGSFIWNRGAALGGALSAAQTEARVRSEYTQLATYLEGLVGANRRSGYLVPMLGGGPDPDAAKAAHLSLLDLARIRENDPAIVTPSDSRSQQIQHDAIVASLVRVHRVEAIVWRAAWIDLSVWDSVAAPTATLKPVIMNEIVARRLRAVERMQFNIGSREEMLGGDDFKPLPREKWGFGSEANANWFDGLRVRLFEYPFAHPDAPVTTTGDDPPWAPEKFKNESGQDVTTRLRYNVLNQTQLTYVSDNQTFTVASRAPWRLPLAEAVFWDVSTDLYGIDPVPDLPANAAELIDDMFDYESTNNGRAIRADYWERSWMYCDHASSAVLLEALLFGRRRSKGRAQADAEFAGLVSREVVLSVPRPHPDGTFTLDQVAHSRFVSLAAHVADSGVGNDGRLMSSGQSSADPHFSNIGVPASQLQVGDQLKVHNSRIFNTISSGGEWGLENAFVMDVDPSVDDKSNRGGIKVPALALQGHGTQVSAYDDYRAFMADILTPNFDKLVRQLMVQKVGPSPPSVITIDKLTSPPQINPVRDRVLIEWDPYGELNQVVLDVPVKKLDGTLVSNVTSGPWWIVIPRDEGQSIADLLTEVPKAIGKPMTTAAGVRPLPSTVHFTPGPGSTFFDRFVLFPLFEPSSMAQAKSDNLPRGASPWSVYFARKAANKTIRSGTVLLSTLMDGSIVPSLLRRNGTVPVPIVQVRVAP